MLATYPFWCDYYFFLEYQDKARKHCAETHLMDFNSDYSSMGNGDDSLDRIVERVYDFVMDYADIYSDLFVFGLSAQIDELKHFFKWMQNYSNEKDLKLVKPITCLDLESLFTHINQSLGHSTSEEELALFADDAFTYYDLCEFHEKKTSPHCAISLARGHAFFLAKHFGHQFGVELKEGQHLPLKYSEYQPLDPKIFGIDSVLNSFSQLQLF